MMTAMQTCLRKTSCPFVDIMYEGDSTQNVSSEDKTHHWKNAWCDDANVQDVDKWFLQTIQNLIWMDTVNNCHVFYIHAHHTLVNAFFFSFSLKEWNNILHCNLFQMEHLFFFILFVFFKIKFRANYFLEN